MRKCNLVAAVLLAILPARAATTAAEPRQKASVGAVAEEFSPSKPPVISQRDDGRVTLFAETAELRGSKIRINPDNYCIAWWSEQADYAGWQVELAAAADFELWLEWAISDELAGNPFVVEIDGKQAIAGTIAASGGWTRLKLAPFGKLHLPAGKSRITLRPAGAIKGELADVRALTLNPAGAGPPPIAPPIPSLSPQESLAAIRVHPRLQVELVAAEPLVQDPIAIAWGPDLRLWVVEMGDYPLGVDGQGKSGGRVKFLEDRDGDGRYDRATTFLDGLSFPTAVLPWRKGVLVCAAPDIFYAEDTNGDGRADVHKTLFTGFPERNQQHRVNGLRLGLDGWVYCANGDGGVGGDTAVTCVATGEQIQIGSRDFRIQPDLNLLELQTGPTQFGRNRDDWGNWFGSNNGQALYHFALDDYYLARNPRVQTADSRVHLLSVGGPFFALSPQFAFHGEPRTPGPRSTGLSSACSGVVYRDTLLGPEFAGNAFVCDPVTNLITRRVLEPQGISFVARRADDEQQSEFFASADPWTRPTMLQAGPDGGLYVVDMYRLYIEHPRWINQDVLERADLRAGHELGRIYRLAPRSGQRRVPVRLDKLSTRELVSALDSSSGWQRDTSQQLLVSQGDKAAAAPLLELFNKSSRPEARLHALWTLAGLKSLPDSVLLAALNDPNPNLRQNAVRLAEPRLSQSPMLQAAVASLTDDDHPRVRLQVAYSLGAWDDVRAGGLLARLIAHNTDQPGIITAALSSATRQPAALLAALTGDPEVPAALLEQVVRTCISADDPASFELLVRQLRPEQAGGSLDRQLHLLAALHAAGPAIAERLTSIDGQIARLYATARKIATDPGASNHERQTAIRLLARQNAELAGDRAQLLSLVSPAVPPPLAVAAVERLEDLDDVTLVPLLADTLGSQSPVLRNRIVAACCARPGGLQAFLDYAETKPQVLAFVDLARRQQWLAHENEQRRAQARRLLGVELRADRQALLVDYLAAASDGGDAERGAQVFKANCASCHQLGDVGFAVGPNLAGIKDKAPRALLEAILDPNRAVEDKFQAFVAVTVDGRTFSGLIQAETGNSLTLAAADGQTRTIQRSDLESLTCTGRSLMPEGFEKTISPTAMADLLAFLAESTRPARVRRAVEGSAPANVTPAADGSVVLLPADAELYGERVGVNTQAKCLAWMSEGDEVIWTVSLAAAGRYDVEIEWAQVDEFDGNTFTLEVAAGPHSRPAHVDGTLATTHGWAKYRQSSFGTIELAGGEQRIALRPLGIVKGELADIRSIRLVPKQ